MKYLILALSLTACGLVDDLKEVAEERLDPPPQNHEIRLKTCTQDSALAATDTTWFKWCKPNQPISINDTIK